MAKTSDTVIKDALERFQESQSASSFNREDYYNDTKFARLADQWPDEIKRQRQQEGRPALVINKLPSLIRSVVNEARMSKPAIKVSPVDSGADEDTAEIIGGLIRNIERQSVASTAYDTAIDHSVTGGFGFFRIDIDYAHDETFELEARIRRIANPLSVHWDVSSTQFDASDWDYAFVSDLLSKEEYKARYPKGSLVSWDGDSRDEDAELWMIEDQIRIAEWFQRIKKQTKLIQLSIPNQQGGFDLQAIREDDLPSMAKRFFEAGNIPVDGLSDKDLKEGFMDISGVTVQRERMVDGYDVKRRIINGNEVLEEDDWPGQNIPICPVWGDEVWMDGRRHFRSLIRDAKDPQMMFNFWRHLCINTAIPTPYGWTTIGEIQVGDELFDENGDVCHVIGKSPVYSNKECYEIEFTDGSKVIASAEHPWMVEERVGRNKDGFVWEYKKLNTGDLEPKKHFIDVAGRLNTERQDLIVHPYIMGQWLGDGTTCAGTVTSNERDVEKIVGVINSFGYECSPLRYNGRGSATYTVYGLQTQLKEIGVFGGKRIPQEYLRGSIEQRWQLLQGLMDSDGSYNQSNNTCGFVTTDEGVSKAFAELLSSLGFKHTHVVRQPRDGMANGTPIIGRKAAYQFSFTAYAGDPVFGIRNPFPDAPKHERRTKRHGIKSVTPIDPVPVQCIGIDAPSHLFLCGESMIPTHNSATTELVALAPKTPWVGPKGFVPKGQEQKWASANTRSHAYLEFDGPAAPQRQQFASVPTGALNEATMAANDLNDITGIYPSAIGAKSNETSGKAIMARERQGDVSNFHFIDNLNRAITYAGKVLVEIIPAVYSPKESIRILGEDEAAKVIQLTQEDGGSLKPGIDGQQRLYNLSVGKYDVDVKTGPSFATQREETRETLIEIMRQVPDAAAFVGDVLLDHMDFVGADKVAKRLKALLPPEVRQAEEAAENSDNPELAAMQQQLQAKDQQMQQAQQAVMQEIERLKAENEAIKQSKQADMMKAQADAQAKMKELSLKERELALKEFDAQKPEPDQSVKIAADIELARERMAFDADQAERDRQLEIVKLVLAKQGEGMDVETAKAEAEREVSQIVFQRDEAGNIVSAVKMDAGVDE